MKIGLAVEFFEPHVGGSEAVVRTLALGLARHGHDVVVATSLDPRRDHRAMPVPVVEFDVRGKAALGMDGDIAGYQRFLLETDRDVWLFYAAQNWVTDSALPLLGHLPAGSVVVPCGYSGLFDPRFADYFSTLPAHLGRAGALVYMSSQTQDFLHDAAAGLGDLATVIPNGAHDEEFADVPDRPATGNHTVLCVANHYRIKGHRTVVKAFQEAAGPHDRLVLVGEDPAARPWHGCWVQCRLAALADRRITLVRGAPRPEVVRRYAEADAFLFGSEFEAAPLVILEAMAAGLPFVTTPAGNVADYEGCGIITTSDQLGRSLRALLADPARRAALGQAGRKRWEEHHRWSVIVERYEDLLARVAADHRRR